MAAGYRGRGSRWRAGVLLGVLVLPAAALLVERARPGVVRAAEPAGGAPARAAVRRAGLAFPDPVALLTRAVAEETPDAPRAAVRTARSPATDEEIAAWVRDLRDDDVPGNAGAALDRLRVVGERAIPFLLEALAGNDRQARQLSAMLLYDLLDEPRPRLVLVAIEGLEHDRLPFDPGPLADGRAHAYTYAKNAGAASEFLFRHPDDARPYLLDRIRSADGQQRFLCACLLGWSGTTEGLPDIVHELCVHLRDNRIRDDGVIAASALAVLGTKALPWMREERRLADEQEEHFLSYLEQYIVDPPRNYYGALKRVDQHGLSDAVFGSHDFAFCGGYPGRIPRFDDDTAGIAAAPAH